MTIANTQEQTSANRSLFALFSFKNLKIGNKLNVGLGLLIALIVVIIVVSYIGTTNVKDNLSRVEDLRLPTAQSSEGARAAMLEMLANIRGYLSLGDPQFLESYAAAKQDYDDNVAEMERLSVNWTNPENNIRLAELKATFTEWEALPQQMFNLYDDPQANQPAQRLLTTEGNPRISTVANNITSMIDEQALREASEDNIGLLKNMADFRGSWNAMAANVRGYLASLDPSFLTEYETALAINDDAFSQLESKRSLMTTTQRATFDEMAKTREEFLPFPEQMFDSASGERAREDLYILSTEAVPRANKILDLLDAMADNQEELLNNDVLESENSLNTAQIETLIGGVIGVIFAIGLSLLLQRDIAVPVVKLTEVADKFGSGELSTRAEVESQDEIGLLATAFNGMAEQLHDTLEDLEQRVADRTRALETSTEVSRQLSTILDLDQLVTEVVEQIRTAFNYYHAHIYLFDDAKHNLMMVGGTGDAGRTMLEAGHHISPTSKGLVRRAATTGQVVLVPDVSRDANWLPNPLLPDTQAELAVPIAVGSEVLGVLDVQQNTIGSLGESDAVLLRSIAGQVAIAVRNARSYTEAQQQATYEALANDITRQIQAATTIEDVLQVAARELGLALKASNTNVHLSVGELANGRN